MKIVVWDINPEPWRAPGVHGRRAVKDGKLEAFQEALADEIRETVGEIEVRGYKKHHLRIWFWRSSAHGQPADTTNLLKATEDSLQTFFGDDKHNLRVTAEIVEQTPETRPCIFIQVTKYKPVAGIDADRGAPPDKVGRWEDSTWKPSTDDF